LMCRIYHCSTSSILFILLTRRSATSTLFPYTTLFRSIYVDSNDDGIDDFVVYNAELGGFNVTGQNVVYVVSLRTGTGAAYYYTEADLNSSNVILTAPLAALGLTQGSRFSFDVYAFDNYFTGSLTDAVEDMTFTVGTPRYAVGSSSLTI